MAVSLADILNELQELLVKTFNRAELRQLLFTKLDLELDHLAPNATGNNDLMFEVVTWMDRRGRVGELIEHAANERNKVPEWQKLLEKSRAKSQPRSVPTANANDRAPPDEVTALVRAYVRLRHMLPDGDKKTVQLQALVNQLLALPLADHNLAELYHLSDCPGERLVAILTLVIAPDLRYLQWLSERLAVESHFVGYQAAVALHSAAATVPRADLDSVAAAVDNAGTWIPGRERQGGRWKKLCEALHVIVERSTTRSAADSGPR